MSNGSILTRFACCRHSGYVAVVDSKPDSGFGCSGFAASCGNGAPLHSEHDDQAEPQTVWGTRRQRVYGTRLVICFGTMRVHVYSTSRGTHRATRRVEVYSTCF
ncbi:MAG: hypothetical protein MK110_14505 [Fuerstiella sp.]|nr:hypothetical protein [Fuerstiella sp.]